MLPSASLDAEASTATRNGAGPFVGVAVKLAVGDWLPGAPAPGEASPVLSDVSPALQAARPAHSRMTATTRAVEVFIDPRDSITLLSGTLSRGGGPPPRETDVCER